jgi:hypothetical protein
MEIFDFWWLLVKKYRLGGWGRSCVQTSECSLYTCGENHFIAFLSHDGRRGRPRAPPSLRPTGPANLKSDDMGRTAIFCLPRSSRGPPRARAKPGQRLRAMRCQHKLAPALKPASSQRQPYGCFALLGVPEACFIHSSSRQTKALSPTAEANVVTAMAARQVRAHSAKPDPLSPPISSVRHTLLS